LIELIHHADSYVLREKYHQHHQTTNTSFKFLWNKELIVGGELVVLVVQAAFETRDRMIVGDTLAQHQHHHKQQNPCWYWVCGASWWFGGVGCEFCTYRRFLNHD
jgi:uncharacterized membrane protein YsdA (DUF1294 family)